ncbi:hypothetical protein JCM5353_006847 [Sporobolomyces roseus]
MTSTKKIRVLLTNDDGPPSDKLTGHSPFIFPFAKGLVEKLGWEVKVVVPSKQRSWAGKSYVIVDQTTGQYFYPDPESEDGTQGELRDLPLKPEERGDKMEMILLDGTPATCASIALHNLFAPDSFDFVLSGPNFGRNTSSAFALSSGTLGAALAGSLSGTPGIALSWGLMEGYKPPGQNLVDAAVGVSCDVVQRLYNLGWGEGANKVDVYSVNVPLMPSILENPEVHWTSMAVTGYGRLFKSLNGSAPKVDDSGPASIPEPKSSSSVKDTSEGDESLLVKEEHYSQPLAFGFAPDITHLVNPDLKNMVQGEDRTTLHDGKISVTPVRAAFAEAKPPPGIAVKDGLTGSARDPKMSHEKGGTTTFGPLAEVSGNAVESDLFSPSISLLESFSTSSISDTAPISRRGKTKQAPMYRRPSPWSTRPLEVDSAESPTFAIYQDPPDGEIPVSLRSFEDLDIYEDPESSGENLLRRAPPLPSSSRIPLQNRSLPKPETFKNVASQPYLTSHPELAVKTPSPFVSSRDSSFTFNFDFTCPTLVRSEVGPEDKLEIEFEDSRLDDFVDTDIPPDPNRPNSNLFQCQMAE